jgi:hypothetical protein
MAKAYLVWNDEKYFQSCVKCAEVTWNKGLLLKGPGKYFNFSLKEV